MKPNLILSPFYWGPLRTQGLHISSALFWAREKAGMM